MQVQYPGLVESAQQLLGVIARVSLAWMVVVTLLALFSTFEFERNFEGDIAFHFHVTTTTALIVALAWLPTLVRAMVMNGGSVKTPAGEASTQGILDLLRPVASEARREVLTSLAAGLDSAEVAAGSSRERGEARAVRRDVERELRGSIVPVGSPSEALDDYARRYEALRLELPYSDERTFQMSSLAAEIRALPGRIPVTPQLVKERFASGSDGDRVVALTLLEAIPLEQCLDQILDGVGNSHSAFEQFQALRAAEEVLPQLGPADRRRLAEVLEAARENPANGIHQDSSRLLPIELMLEAINGPRG